MRLVAELAALHERPLGAERALEVAAVLSGPATGGAPWRARPPGAVPVAGWAVSGGVAYAATRAIGEAALALRSPAGHERPRTRPAASTRAGRAGPLGHAKPGPGTLRERRRSWCRSTAPRRAWRSWRTGARPSAYIERRGQRSVVGHVWKGRVENVLAGMEAAFVDVGLDKNGFLHVDEVVALGVPKRKRQIADLLKQGDEMLVQATKDPMGSKGARLTMQLSLAGPVRGLRALR